MQTFHQPSFKNHSKVEKMGGVHTRVYMYFFLELFPRAHVTCNKQCKFNNKLWYRKGCYVHYERGVILEDIAPPPHERLGPLRCLCHRVPTRSSPSAVWAVHTSVQLETSVLGHTYWCWVRDVSASCSRWHSAQKIGVGLYCIHILAILPGVFHVHGGCQRWPMG